MLLEQAVSIWTLGPTRSKYQLILLAMIDGDAPVTTVLGAVSGSLANIRRLSSPVDAVKTAVDEPLTLSMGMPA
jgi:hypothetical protein